MQREAIILEKEVAAKNNKIYELEMSYLKGSRGVQKGTVQVGNYGRNQE